MIPSSSTPGDELRAEALSAQDVEMPVENRLTAVKSYICQHTVSALVDLLRSGDALAQLQHFRHERRVVRRRRVKRNDMGLRHDKAVDRGLRETILDRDRMVSLGNADRWQLTCNDLAENAVVRVGGGHAADLKDGKWQSEGGRLVLLTLRPSDLNDLPC